jgi:nitroreductase
MNQKLKEDLKKENRSKEYIKAKIMKTRQNFLEAPYLILLCLDNEKLEKHEIEKRKEAEHIMGIQSVSTVATYLLLAFEIKGLASCWYCAPLFAGKIVKKFLNLPESFEPMAFFTVGFPMEKQKKPSRLNLNEVIYQISDKGEIF